MNIKKYLSKILIITLFISCLDVIPQTLVYAKSKVPILSDKSITLTQGIIKAVRLKHVSQTVKWKVVSGKKVIKIIKKSGKHRGTVKIKGIDAGNAVLQAKYGKKTYKVQITVKKNIELPKEEATILKIIPAGPEEYATITFDCLGGLPIESIKRKIGEPYGELPRAEYEDYVFLGWETEKYNGKRISETDICKGDITLYAHLVGMLEVEWGNCTRVYLYLDDDMEKQPLVSIWIEYDEPFEHKLPIPIKEGYRFLGWYTGDGYKVKYDDICPMTIDRKLPLYARFESCS